MPRFSANLSMLFNEHEFLDRFEAAARAGFMGVEYISPYDVPASAIAKRLRENKLSQVLFNLPPGNLAAGERGIASLPDRVEEFRSGLDVAIEYAGVLDCHQVTCMAGIAPRGVDLKTLESVLLDNLRFAAEKLHRHGIRLLLEPINIIDMPGYFVSTSRHALSILDAVGSNNLYLQYDIYHMQIMEGDLARGMERQLHRISHVQLADNPGRHEPGSGEINYRFLCRHLDGIGYDGWIGAEYRPRAGTVAGLGWLTEFIERK